jgi:hypothetical protein
VFKYLSSMSDSSAWSFLVSRSLALLVLIMLLSLIFFLTLNKWAVFSFVVTIIDVCPVLLENVQPNANSHSSVFISSSSFPYDSVL